MATVQRALERLESELVVAHRRAGRRRRKRTALWSALAAFTIAASSAVAAVLLRDQEPIVVPGAPISLPAPLRSQVDADSVRVAWDSGRWIYFTASGSAGNTRCLLAAPAGASEIAASACDPARVVAERGVYITHPGTDKGVAGAALLGVEADTATVNGVAAEVHDGVVGFRLGPRGGRIDITTTAPSWSTAFSFPDPAAVPEPKPYPVVTVTTPGGFGDR